MPRNNQVFPSDEPDSRSSFCPTGLIWNADTANNLSAIIVRHCLSGGTGRSRNWGVAVPFREVPVQMRHYVPGLREYRCESKTLFQDRRVEKEFAFRWLSGTTIGRTRPCILALPFSNYTGVLIRATAIPVWNCDASYVPLRFGASAWKPRSEFSSCSDTACV